VSYVIQREDGMFVAPSGMARSYTSMLQRARLFPSREAAQSEACGNERVLSLEEAAAGRLP